MHKNPFSYPKLHVEGLQEEGLCVARCGAEARLLLWVVVSGVCLWFGLKGDSWFWTFPSERAGPCAVLWPRKLPLCCFMAKKTEDDVSGSV